MSWVCKFGNSGYLKKGGFGEITTNIGEAEEFTEQELSEYTKTACHLGLRVYKDFYFIIKGGNYE